MITHFTIRYSNAHFQGDTEELKSLQTLLGNIAPSKLRARHVDLGGVETAIWIYASYVGMKYLDAIFAEIAASHIKGIVQKVTQVFPANKENDAETVPVTLVLELDDLDLEINLPLDTRSEFAKSLLETIQGEMKRPPLVESGRIDRIHVPLARNGEFWSESFQWSGANYDYRYWGLNYFGEITAAYDLQERVIIDIPPGNLE
ncbi:MAG TPA: hypothetical protein VGE39_06945 [Prosthecobacter sp.]